MEVGGQCLHLDHSVTGTWIEMREFCQAMGGDLVNLGNVQFYEDVLMYIRTLGELSVCAYKVNLTFKLFEHVWIIFLVTHIRIFFPRKKMKHAVFKYIV